MLEKETIDDVQALLAALPPAITEALSGVEGKEDLLEVVMDLGREPSVRFRTGEVVLSPTPITEQDIAYVIAHIGAFGDDNRAGIERTLHRISAIRNRQGKVIGLTCRLGRAVFGTIAIIQDLVESGKSMLMLGRPGVGKTTLLREVARVLADDFHKRVIIVDTSNEIAGDGDIPHPGIGRARRMQVATPASQHAVMIEAVENHMPEVIVIDEIGTELEAQAARTIAERGVQLVGTAHGNTLDNLMQNPTLSDLIGGIQTVTLSDEEARRRGTQKSVLERKAPPTFDVVVEIQDWHHVTVHPDVGATVDALLLGRQVAAQIRERSDDGQVKTVTREPDSSRRPPSNRTAGSAVFTQGANALVPRARGFTAPHIEPATARGGMLNYPASAPTTGSGYRLGNRLTMPDRDDDDDDESFSDLLEMRPARAATATPPETDGPRGQLEAAIQPLRILPFGISRPKLEEVARALHLPVIIARDLKEADVLLTLKNYYRKNSPQLRDAQSNGVPIYVLKSNTAAQIEVCLMGMYNMGGGTSGGSPAAVANPMTAALQEAEDAITQVIDSSQPIDLAPQNAYVRRLQHRLAERYNLQSRSRGRDPYRRVRIFPDQYRITDE